MTSCKYFDPSLTNANEYVAPDVCIATKTDGISSSYIYECTSSSEVTAKFYLGTNNSDCSGDPSSKIQYLKDDGFSMNCSENAKDCSAVYREYSHCNLNGDYEDHAVVTNTCIDLTSEDTSMWNCNATAVIYTLYASQNCQEDGTQYIFANGCQGHTYYQVFECNDD